MPASLPASPPPPPPHQIDIPIIHHITFADGTPRDDIVLQAGAWLGLQAGDADRVLRSLPGGQRFASCQHAHTSFP